MTTVSQVAKRTIAMFPEVTAMTAYSRASPADCPEHRLSLLGPDRMALKATTHSTQLASVAEIIGINPSELESAFVCEEWSAELATGIVRLGPETASLHGICSSPCGIMDLIRLYDSADLSKVLQALEDAATSPSVFTFSTTLRPGPGLYRPVFCFGQSDTVDGTSDMIHGTFAVARLCMRMGSRPEALN